MVDKEKVKQGVELILEAIGEDKNRPGLKDTPDRIARMYEEIFAGMDMDERQPLSRKFDCPDTNMVIEKDITFYSTCEHHFMPFFGKAHVAYIPDGQVVGLSKLARCVDICARRPQIQEQMTEQIALALMDELEPKGVIVMLEAEHTCMTMRGIKKPGSKTVTYVVKGEVPKESIDRFFTIVKNS